MNRPTIAAEFRSVRWPFRLLAALILATAFLAVMGSAWAAYTGHGYATDQGAGIRLIATLPAIAWMLNFAWSAAIRGRSPTNEHWPFASHRVLMAYMVALYIFS